MVYQRKNIKEWGARCTSVYDVRYKWTFAFIEDPGPHKWGMNKKDYLLTLLFPWNNDNPVLV